MNNSTNQDIISSLPSLNLAGLARVVRQDWQKDGRSNVNFAARPYLSAMQDLNSLNDFFGCDSASSIVNYFLCNASGWRGEIAKAVKAELKRRIQSVK